MPTNPPSWTSSRIAYYHGVTIQKYKEENQEASKEASKEDEKGAIFGKLLFGLTAVAASICAFGAQKIEAGAIVFAIGIVLALVLHYLEKKAAAVQAPTSIQNHVNKLELTSANPNNPAQKEPESEKADPDQHPHL